MDTKAIMSAFEEIAEANQWQALHSPRNLASAVSVEAAELLEQFQWLNDEQSMELAGSPQACEAVGDEVADIIMYLLALCKALNLDIDQLMADKIAKNRRRFLND